MVYIQYASDLHIQDYPPTTPFETFLRPVSSILVIAGDVCSAWDPLYAHFLAWCSRHWTYIILVSGNHEYFCDPSVPRTIAQTDEEIRRICGQHTNVFFLQAGASVFVSGIRFVGATLWSAIEPAIWEEVAMKKGDFLATYTRGRNTTPSDICALHALHKACLRTAMATEEPLVVVTHHLPTRRLLDPQYRQDKWRSCYASADDELLIPNIRVWICGHSHRSTRWQPSVEGPLCVINARGYKQEQQLSRYNPEATVWVP